MAVAEITFIVDPDGGVGADYFSIKDWDAAEVTGSMIANDERYTVKCRSSAGSADTAAVTFSTGWSTDATHYVKIWTDPSDTGTGGGGKDFGGGATHRHDGKWNANAFRLESSTSSCMLNPSGGINFLRIIGIQFHLISSGSFRYCMRNNAVAGELLIDKCIAKGTITSNGGCIAFYFIGSGADGYLFNSTIYDFAASGLSANYGASFGGASGDIYLVFGNTFVNCQQAAQVGFSSTSTVKNNYWKDCGTGIAGSGIDVANKNGADNGAQSLGTNFVTYDAQFVDEASDDFHLTATDVATLVGEDLTGDFGYASEPDIEKDIDNDTRVDWSIGADDGPSASGDIEASGAGSSTGTTAIVGYGLIQAAGVGSSTGSVSIVGQGVVVASGTGSSVGTATITGQGLVAASASGSSTGSAEIAGDGHIAALGAGSATGTAALMGTGFVEASGAGAAAGSAEIAGVHLIEASGAGTSAGAAELQGTGFATASGAGSSTGAASLLGTGLIEAAGSGIATGNAALFAVGFVEAAGIGAATGSVEIFATGSIVAAGAGVAAGNAVLTGEGFIEATGAGSSTGDAALAGIGYFIASGAGVATGEVVIAGTGFIEAGGIGVATGDASITAVGFIEASGAGSSTGAAVIRDAFSGSFDAEGHGSSTGNAEIFGVGLIEASGAGNSTGAAAIEATGSIEASGAGSSEGIVEVFGVGFIEAAGAGTSIGSASLSTGVFGDPFYIHYAEIEFVTIHSADIECSLTHNADITIDSGHSASV